MCWILVATNIISKQLIFIDGWLLISISLVTYQKLKRLIHNRFGLCVYDIKATNIYRWLLVAYKH